MKTTITWQCPQCSAQGTVTAPGESTLDAIAQIAAVQHLLRNWHARCERIRLSYDAVLSEPDGNPNDTLDRARLAQGAEGGDD